MNKMTIIAVMALAVCLGLGVSALADDLSCEKKTHDRTTCRNSTGDASKGTADNQSLRGHKARPSPEDTRSETTGNASYYDRTGRRTGRSRADSLGNASYYDRAGRRSGRSR
ncbi:MAG: hypothetical protein LBP92_03240 [Deltaproteobacteria bacterium]|jgi:hypothetical protein|nr:hypothetical protein [Deltaproteobacteria bacterium]